MSIEAKLRCHLCDSELFLIHNSELSLATSMDNSNYSGNYPFTVVAPHECKPKEQPPSEIDLLKERVKALEEELLNIKNMIKFDRMRNRPIRC